LSRIRKLLTGLCAGALLTGGVVALAPQAAAAAPQIANITPSTGPAGTQVTINGTDLGPFTTVKFDGVATSYTANSSSQLVAIAPAHANGPAAVKVETSQGASNTVTFTYGTTAPPPTTTPPPPPPSGSPTITELLPAQGPPGTEVIINGTSLSGTSMVTFGGYPSPQVTVLSSTQVKAKSPANMTGTVDVRVSTSTGNSNTKSYTYQPANYYPVPVGPGTSIQTEDGPFAGGSWCNIAAVGRDDHNRLVALTAGHCNTKHDVSQPVYWSPTVEHPKVQIGTFETINSHPEYVGTYPLNSQMDYAIVLLDETKVAPRNTTPTGQVYDHLNTTLPVAGVDLMSKYGQVSGYVANCAISAVENNVIYSAGCGNLPGDSGGGVIINGGVAGVNSGTDPFASGGRNNLFTHISGILADLAAQGPNTVGIGFEPLAS
jgi:hypothetical protein